MKPILFRIFDFAVPSYSVFMVLGYVAALLTLFALTPKGADDRSGGLNRAQVWDLYIVMVISSVIGAKLGHVLFEAPGHVDEHGQPLRDIWELLKSDPWHWARLGEAGYVWYGGLIGALLIAVIYFRNRPRLDAWLYCDTFAPAIMFGAVWGRVGCFFAGCCYGIATDKSWGVVFPGKAHAVHPTQLYDALVAGLIGALLVWRYPRRRFTGENIALLLLFYPLLRSMTEVFRGDEDRGLFGPLSTSQLLSIPLFAIGGWLYLRLSKQQPAAAPSTPEAQPEAP